MISTAKTKDKAIVPVLYRRDRVTWLSFLLLGTYSYLQAAPGPLMPFVQETFHFNQTIASLHLSLFAFGMILAGVVGKQAILRWSRWQLLWGGGTGMVVGALLFASGWHPVVTLFSTFVMGFFGSLLFVALQAILVDRHAAHQATAISEANVVASLGATLSSTCLAALVIVGLGWRAMLCVPVLVFFVLALLFRTDAEIDTGQRQQRVQKTARARLPLAFWFSWTILLFGVAIEWSMAFCGGRVPGECDWRIWHDGFRIDGTLLWRRDCEPHCTQSMDPYLCGYFPVAASLPLYPARFSLLLVRTIHHRSYCGSGYCRIRCRKPLSSQSVYCHKSGSRGCGWRKRLLCIGRWTCSSALTAHTWPCFRPDWPPKSLHRNLCTFAFAWSNDHL